MADDNEAATRVKVDVPAVPGLLRHNAPLGLPTGSVRALLALGLVGALVLLVALGIAPNGIETAAAGALGFYFGGRNGKSTGG